MQNLCDAALDFYQVGFVQAEAALRPGFRKPQDGGNTTGSVRGIIYRFPRLSIFGMLSVYK